MRLGAAFPSRLSWKTLHSQATEAQDQDYRDGEGTGDARCCGFVSSIIITELGTATGVSPVPASRNSSSGHEAPARTLEHRPPLNHQPPAHRTQSLKAPFTAPEKTPLPLPSGPAHSPYTLPSSHPAQPISSSAPPASWICAYDA